MAIAPSSPSRIVDRTPGWPMIRFQSIPHETSKGLVYTTVNGADNKRRTRGAEGGHRCAATSKQSATGASPRGTPVEIVGCPVMEKRGPWRSGIPPTRRAKRMDQAFKQGRRAANKANLTDKMRTPKSG
jgi:hypothetical protein